MLERWFPESASVVAREIDRLFWYSTAWTGAVGIIVIVILALFLVRYREKTGRLAFYTHGNSPGAIGMTLTLAALVFVLLDLNLAYHDHLVWNQMFARPPQSADAVRVQVMPEQFAWNVRYPGLDDTFGTADDVVSINEMHVPVGRPVIVQLVSKDVIHSFFLPNLRIKQDAIPGMVTSIYFVADRMGTYNIACAEHCGIGHYRMKGTFVSQSQDEYHAWMEVQSRESAEAISAPWAWDWERGLVAGTGPAPLKEIRS